MSNPITHRSIRRASVTPNRKDFNRVLATDALAESLSREILSGQIPAGSHLAEVELAEAYGVSRQTLRLALGVLAGRGLVRREAHRGSWVADLDLADLRDLYGFRTLIEVEAARHLAVDLTAVEPVEDALERLRTLPHDARWDEVSDADFAFHGAIVATMGSPRRSRAHQQLMNETRLSMVPVRYSRTHEYMVSEHADILRTIREGDPDLAGERIRQHLDLGLQYLQQTTRQHPLPDP